MTPHVTGLYAALLAIVGIVLTAMVGQMRGRTKISLGDNGRRELIVANRRHMNYVENVPLARSLYATVDIDEEIPVEHYHAVAEIIGFVMRLKRGFSSRP